jgi:L-ribulose-5-phosphate 3-epimerase
VKLGVNLWTVYGWEPSEIVSIHVLERLSRIGAEGVELVIDEDHFHADRLIAEGDRLRPRLKDLGLEVPSIASGLFWKYNLGSSNKSVRHQGLEVIRQECRVARDYGAKVVLVVPGYQEPRTDYNLLYERSVESLQAAAKIAEEFGVTIGVENVAVSFLRSPREYSQFLKDIGSPWVAAYLDVGNVLALGIMEYPENWIMAVSDMIAIVHVKDFDKTDGSLRGFRLCGQGDLDWATVLEVMREAKYDNYLILETPPQHEAGQPFHYPDDGLEAAQVGLQFLKRQLFT